MARARKRGPACDPLDGRLGFKDGALAGPPLELNSQADEDSQGRKRRVRPRAAPAGQRLPRMWRFQ